MDGTLREKGVTMCATPLPSEVAGNVIRHCTQFTSTQRCKLIHRAISIAFIAYQLSAAIYYRYTQHNIEHVVHSCRNNSNPNRTTHTRVSACWPGLLLFVVCAHMCDSTPLVGRVFDVREGGAVAVAVAVVCGFVVTPTNRFVSLIQYNKD